MLDLSTSQSTRFSLASSDGALQVVIVMHDSEVGEGQIPRVASSDGGRA